MRRARPRQGKVLAAGLAARLAAGIALLALASCSLLAKPIAAGDQDFSACSDADGEVAWEATRRAIMLGEDQVALAQLAIVVERCPSFVRGHVTYQDVARRVRGEHERAMIARYTAGESGSREQSLAAPLRSYLKARLADTAYAQANALEAILAEHPTFAWANLSLGRVNRGQGRLSEALGNFEAAIGEDASLFEARLERAQVLADLGRDEEAALDYRSYVTTNPGDLAAVREYVSLLLYRLARIDEALEYIRLLERSGDRSQALRMDRAAAMWRNNLPQAAIEIYLEILRAAPATARAALNIGLLYYEIVPKDATDRRRFWPKARAAFELFLQTTEPTDGHEQFERTWAVPFRLGRIRELLGPALRKPTLDDLRWPQ